MKRERLDALAEELPPARKAYKGRPKHTRLVWRVQMKVSLGQGYVWSHKIELSSTDYPSKRKAELKARRVVKALLPGVTIHTGTIAHVEVSCWPSQI